LLLEVDFVFHLAGVNRPKSVDDFKQSNQDLTLALLKKSPHGKRVLEKYPVVGKIVVAHSTKENKLPINQNLKK